LKSKIPHFKSEDEEARYWETHAVTDHLDELVEVEYEIEITSPRRNKKPINIRVDEDALDAIKDIAGELRIPYQTLIGSWLVEKLRKDYPEALRKHIRSTKG
jgi:predicted DNA binding CopG/RHH family protein